MKDTEAQHIAMFANIAPILTFLVFDKIFYIVTPEATLLIFLNASS
jgi:hypothetical protein